MRKHAAGVTGRTYDASMWSSVADILSHLEGGRCTLSTLTPERQNCYQKGNKKKKIHPKPEYALYNCDGNICLCAWEQKIRINWKDQ